MNKQRTPLQGLLIEILSDSDKRIDKLIPANSISADFQRPIYHRLLQQALRFAASKKGIRWNVMVGLRGVGKTTLLAQIYLHPQLKVFKKFYLSFDRAQLLGVNLDDLETALEHLLGKRLLETDQPLFLFLDEVHSLKQWSLLCKTLYDDYANLFLICTSSSALSLWADSDMGRRAQYFQIGPLSLAESTFLRNRYKQPLTKKLSLSSGSQSDFVAKSLKPNLKLGDKIRRALFEQKTAIDVCNDLHKLKKEIGLYFNKINRQRAVDNYILNYGTLPYVFALGDKLDDLDFKNKETIFGIRAAIRQTLEKVYNQDLPIIDQANRFENMFPRLLLQLANADQLSLSKISQHFHLNFRTLRSMLETLVKSEVLLAVKPFGASFGKSTKPSKYLFKCPAIRQSLWNLQNQKEFSRLSGHLLEDAVGFYLKQIFEDQSFHGVIEYDSSQVGADFIVMPNQLKKEAISIEVGWNKKSDRQVQATMSRIKSDRYGLIITNCQISLAKSQSVVFVPIEVFLLMQPDCLEHQDVAESINLKSELNSD